MKNFMAAQMEGSKKQDLVLILRYKWIVCLTSSISPPFFLFFVYSLPLVTFHENSLVFIFGARVVRSSAIFPLGKIDSVFPFVPLFSPLSHLSFKFTYRLKSHFLYIGPFSDTSSFLLSPFSILYSVLSFIFLSLLWKQQSL